MDFDKNSICSDFSGQSDEVRSNISTFSGLSTYQDEFADLCHLVNPNKYPTSVFEKCSHQKHDSGGESNEERISNLARQLQNSLKLNEKYKYDLYNLEKTIELKYYEKIDKLLRSNNKMQLELDNANEQIGRLIRNFSTKKDTTSQLDRNFIQLEQKYHDLTVQNSTLEYELLEIKSAKEECELQNTQVRTELAELKIDINAKNGCITDLKEKISQQHIEIQSLLKNSLLATQSLNDVASELEHVKKTRDWYKDQLHLCQTDKKDLSNELLKLKTDISLENEDKELLNVEIARWKNKCDIAKLEALREKEKFYKQLEQTNYVSVPKNSQPQSDFVANNDYKNIVNYYESTIQDLTDEVTKVKDFVQEQDENMKKLAKENAELMGACITLQKTIHQNEINTEQLECERKRLNMELNSVRDAVKVQSDEVTCSKKQVIVLESELSIRKEEKELIENTVRTIREQFTMFKAKYVAVKDELTTKNKQILQLQTEKQKLFMNNNWNICELEKMKEKDEALHKLNNVIANYERELSKQLVTIKRQENELNEKEDVNKSLLEEKRLLVDRHAEEIRNYEDVLKEFNIMAKNYEIRVNDLQDALIKSSRAVTDLEDNINILKQEVNRRNLELSEMASKCVTLENNFKLVNDQNRNSIKQFSEENGDVLGRVLCSFMKIYHIGNDGTNGSQVVEPGDINKMLKNVDTYLQDNFINKTLENDQNNSKQLKLRIHKLKDVKFKIAKLEDRTKRLSDKIENFNRMLAVISSGKDRSSNEKLQELKVLLQVKEMELKEKQKKYETNNRTLLRKVKEHMKGRNQAEKHKKFLQDLCASLTDENTSLKLSFSSKEYEIENVKKLLGSHISINDKLKQTVSKLEEKVYKNSMCEKCLEYAAVMNKIGLLEKYVAELEDEKIQIQNVVMSKEDSISKLQKEKQEILEQNLCLVRGKNKCEKQIEEIQSDKQHLSNKISTLEEELKRKQLHLEEVNLLFKEENGKFLECLGENTELKNNLDQTNSKLQYLADEITILRSALQSRSEELDRLEAKHSNLDTIWKQKERDAQNVIATLKNHLHNIQVDVTSVNSEKFFLQRLCNDLKLALKTHVNHNKMLKQQINNLSREKQDFNSLPNILPDIPNSVKYDDEYINQLLQQNRAPLQDKPLTEIKGCLDTLRREISTLQGEIAKKNNHSS